MQHVGAGCGGLCLAISFSARAMTCFGSQNCRACGPGIRVRVLPLGGLQSVARMGSHTTNTRTSFSVCRVNICWAAEAPRRQVGHVGDNRRTKRGASLPESNASLN